MDTMKLPTKPDYLAPDGSEIRLLVATPRGSMAHCRLPPNAVTKPVWHQSVEELWYCVSGRGELWRKYGSKDETIPLEPGTSALIGFQEHFQFRASDQPLELILATIPGWPGAKEAVESEYRKWKPTISEHKNDNVLDEVNERLTGLRDALNKLDASIAQGRLCP